MTVKSGRIARLDLGLREQKHLINPRRLDLELLDLLSDCFNNSAIINIKIE